MLYLVLELLEMVSVTMHGKGWTRFDIPSILVFIRWRIDGLLVDMLNLIFFSSVAGLLYFNLFFLSNHILFWIIFIALNLQQHLRCYSHEIPFVLIFPYRQKDGPGAPGGQSWTVQWLKFDNSYFKVSTILASFYILRK